MRKIAGKAIKGPLIWIIAVILLAAVAVVLILGRREPEDRTFHSDLFGDQVYIFKPEDDPSAVQAVLDRLYRQQETNQFGGERYAVYFMPGEYDESITVNVGYYMQIAGLGILPADTKIKTLQCTARWLGDASNHNATCNFWRGVENIELGSNTVWAVSQATSMRRVQVDGALYLHDEYGWSSGGFLSDSKIDLMVDSGSQQQWLSRNDSWKKWIDDNWNMVFVGIQAGEAPTGTWPVFAYTAVDKTPAVKEKPFLIYDGEAGFEVFVPALREDSSGISWENGAEGERIPLDQFYIAKAGKDTSESINNALAQGKNLLLTPGVYELDHAIEVRNPDTVVLGMGLATLQPVNGNACMVTSDVDGLNISGILFDAGQEESENLLMVGDDAADPWDQETDHPLQDGDGTADSKREESADNPSHEDIPSRKDGASRDNQGDGYISLSDLYFRVGGASAEYAAKADTCVTINSDYVIGDNFWVWRADHGTHVGWDENTARNGIVINGDHVTMYALMVEHFQEYQTIWNGNYGRNYMYQSELPYDVPDQGSWMSADGTKDGYASFKVGDGVTEFEAWGIGIYSYHRDAVVNEESVMEVPESDGIRIHNICAVMITGNPGISHIINRDGEACLSGGQRQIIREYQNGIIK